MKETAVDNERKLLGRFSRAAILVAAALVSAIALAAPRPKVPNAPAGLTATSGDGQVALKWNAVSNAAYYTLKRSTTSGGPYAAVPGSELTPSPSPFAMGLTGTSYTNTGLTNGTTYYYVVSASNSVGEGANSAQVSAKPQAAAATVPAAPVALIAVAGDGRATLSWEPSANAASYTVSRSTTNGGPYTTIATAVTSASHLDSGLTNGTVYFYVVSAVNAVGTSPNATQARVTPVSAPVAGTVLWPLSSSPSNNADAVRYQYGPRRIGEYDFHGGIDIPANEGTPIYAVMDGTVTGITLDNGSTGPGNRVLVNHGQQKWAGYLHMSAFAPGIAVGAPVTAGMLLGYVGMTGASSNHLHLTYMVGLLSESTSESRSKNPMEILAHAAPTGVTAVFKTDGSNSVEISLPAHRMSVRWVILKGAGQTRLVDYYEVVAQGSTNRNTQSQYGVYIDAAAPPLADPAANQNFKLTVRPDPVSSFTVDRVILKDFKGVTLLDQVK
jgi:murein DD-endopeptidase MepM/ murein hydrolase activator NlpD